MSNTDLQEFDAPATDYSRTVAANGAAKAEAADIIDAANKADIHELLDLYLAQIAAVNAGTDALGAYSVAARIASKHANTINDIANAKFGIQFTGGMDGWL